jgi:hypothetical protein
MSWFDEFESYYEIPGIIPFLIRKGILKDLSWHNDVAPSFGVVQDDGSDIRIWVDHPFKSHRQYQEARFMITVTEKEDSVFSFYTDDLEEALETLFSKLALWYKRMLPGVLDWRPLETSEWDDPSEYLDELKREYLSDPRA